MDKLEQIMAIIEETTKAQQEEIDHRKGLAGRGLSNKQLCQEIHESNCRGDALAGTAYYKIKQIVQG